MLILLLLDCAGPKLYETNCVELTRDGYIANVSSYEIRCPMTAKFLEQYNLHDGQGNGSVQ